MNITGNRVGTVVNFFMENGLQSKDFHTNELADLAYKALLNAKSDPTEENIGAVYDFLNKNIRIARAGGFEFEPNTSNIYMKGFYSTPVPESLMKTVEEYVENGYPTESITNFWKLLMANPDKRVRESLFKFIEEHNFVLTDKGYMIVYKTVDHKNMVTQDIASFVSNAYLKVRKDWGTSPKRYVVFKQFSNTDLEDFENFELKMTKKSTFDKWDVDEKRVELIGRLDELQTNLDDLIDGDNSTVFTDLHTHTMDIRLGEPVKMDITECDSDPANDCSHGLHVGATKYVEKFAGWYSSTIILVCLVNPMNVVAVPNYDHSKMRVTEYFPFALGNIDDEKKIDIIQEPFFEYDYISHEESELEKILASDMDDIRTTSYNAPTDERTDEEYVAILKSRVVDLRSE